MKEKLILIGNGMAGIRTLEELLKLAPNKYDITVFGNEIFNNYNRILLSPFLAGEKCVDDIILNPNSWYADNNITLHRGIEIASIDTHAQTIYSAGGDSHHYDRLIIATGSTPFVPPIIGTNLSGVVCFRTIDDVQEMLSVAQADKKAIIIGGGLLGLEAAEGLLQQGMNVTVVHLLDHLMETQLDDAAAELLKADLEKRGIHFEMNARTETLLGENKVKGIRLSDGRVLEAELVVLSVGIRPNTHLVSGTDIVSERGIIVDDQLKTSNDRVFAVGECVQHRNKTFGLVAPLYEQARVLAHHLAGDNSARYEGSDVSAQLKVSGISLFSAGDLYGDDNSSEIVLHDTVKRTYKKIVIGENKVKGVILYGDTFDGAWLFQHLKDGTEITDIHEQLIFGQGYGSGDLDTVVSRVAALPDSAEICGCNGICKGEIVTAITEQGLTSFEAVRTHTKAAASCGSCSNLVEAVLTATLGESYDLAAEKRSMCGCTSLSHEDVRIEIKKQTLKSIPQLIRALGWNTNDGCHDCRPALNLYLLVAWPGEYQDDGRSRHVNERIHANIQKDGTYAVVPRIWGGLTSASELRALGEIAEKYGTAVKITGGQRIALAGVSKENLPNIWKDMNDAGFISGHAYGKALRSVKTCVGDLLCGYGIRDSIPLGIEIEKMAWGAWTPHKVKMGVSGCPRNCAEATIKDLGFVATEAGWEVYVGGNGGARAKVGQHFTQLKSSEEAKLFAAAFLQLYREEGRYKERTADWLERIGLDLLQQRLVDDAQSRMALVDRFLYAMECGQTDPWKEQVENQDQSEYQPIKLVAS